MPAIRLFGLPTDINSSFERGAAAGPAAIREALWSDRGNMASELGPEIGPEIGSDIPLTDAGDLQPTEDTAQDDAMIRRPVADVREAGDITFDPGPETETGRASGRER